MESEKLVYLIRVFVESSKCRLADLIIILSEVHNNSIVDLALFQVQIANAMVEFDDEIIPFCDKVGYITQLHELNKLQHVLYPKRNELMLLLGRINEKLSAICYKNPCLLKYIQDSIINQDKIISQGTKFISEVSKLDNGYKAMALTLTKILNTIWASQKIPTSEYLPDTTETTTK